MSARGRFTTARGSVSAPGGSGGEVLDGTGQADPAQPGEPLGGDAGFRVLRWRCRRGMKELDVLLERYAARALPRADAAERRLLARLLERPDPELAGYLLGGEAPPEPEMAALVTRIAGSCMIGTLESP